MSPWFELLRQFTRAKEWTAPWMPPPWQSHRGYRPRGELENSMESLSLAREAGARMCEFDVRLTQDQVPVLFHDEELTRLARRPGRLDQTRFEELRKWVKAPSLKEVFLSNRVPDLLNVELKSEKIWNEPLERKVYEVVKKTGVQNRILFSSFNPFSLWKMQSYLPEVPRALLISENLSSVLLREMMLAPLLSLQALHFQDRLIEGPEFVQAWKKRGFRVAVWTVNESEQMKKFWSWGVDSVITDHIPE